MSYRFRLPARFGAGLLIVAAAALSTGCGGSSSAAAKVTPTPTDSLAHYTDTGDACAQAISAIAYADDSLLALGQEPYQDFDDLVRSKLAAVAGTLSLEADDWPSPRIYQQAKVVQPLAQAAGARAPDKDPARIRTLLTYRMEAAKLILMCRY
jgi:hypothetical protein